MSSIVTDSKNRKIKKAPSKLLPPKISNKVKDLNRKVSSMNLKSTPHLKIKIPDNNFLENNNSNKFIPINKNSSSKDTMSPPSERNTPRSKSPASNRLRERAARSNSPLFRGISPPKQGSVLGKYTKSISEKPNPNINFFSPIQSLTKKEHDEIEEFEKKFYPKNLLDITKVRKGGRKSRKRIRHKYKNKSRKLKKKRTRKLKKKRTKKIKIKKRKTKKRKFKKKRSKKIKLKKRTRNKKGL